MEKDPDTGSGIVELTSLIGLGLTSIGYARFLNTAQGRRLATDHTWVTVVIGVLYTLFWLSFTDVKMATKLLSYFAVSGTPMIARSLINGNTLTDSSNTQDSKGGDGDE